MQMMFSRVSQDVAEGKTYYSQFKVVEFMFSSSLKNLLKINAWYELFYTIESSVRTCDHYLEVIAQPPVCLPRAHWG